MTTTVTLAVVVLIVRSLLAATFIVAAIAKFIDRAGTVATLIEFGLPYRLARGASVLLPATELSAGLLLLAPGLEQRGAIAALLLLAMFIAAMLVNLAKGRAPSCNCFGQLHAEPIGPRALIRNVALAVGAGIVATSQTPVVDPMTPVVMAAGVIGTWLLLRQLRWFRGTVASAAVPAPPSGLAPGSPSPAVDEVERLREPGKPLLLVFANPNCGPCAALLPEIARWQAQYADAMTIAVLHGRPEIAERFLAFATPAAVIIDADDAIGSTVALGRDAIVALLPAPPAPRLVPALEEFPDWVSRSLQLGFAAARSRREVLRATLGTMLGAAAASCGSMTGPSCTGGCAGNDGKCYTCDTTVPNAYCTTNRPSTGASCSANAPGGVYCCVNTTTSTANPGTTCRCNPGNTYNFLTGVCCPNATPEYYPGTHGQYAVGCYASCPYVGDCGTTFQRC